MGLYPTVFADEYLYSKFARLKPLNEAILPNFLYFSLYRVTNYCGDGFLACARTLNALFFVAAAPFIFMTARTVASSPASLAISALVLISPISNHTAYFMPESLYFFGFWAFVWSLLRLEAKSPIHNWAGSGAIYGLLALVKPHALLFMPAILLYTIHLCFRQQVLFSRVPFLNGAALIASAVSIKLIAGYLLAGPTAVTLFGSFYGSMDLSRSGRFVELLAFSLENLKGHMAVLAFIYGLPLALAVTLTLRQFTGSAFSNGLEKLSFFSLFVIANLICVTVLFTASIADLSTYETPYRLHMRYYNFALPLFFILAAGSLNHTEAIGRGLANYLLVGALGLLVIFALHTELIPYSHVFSAPGNPEIRGLHANKLVFQMFGALSLIALFAWAALPRAAIRMYLFVLMPLSMVVSSFFVTLDQRKRMHSDVFDRAALFVKQYLSAPDISKVLIVGSDLIGLHRSLFHLDNAKAALAAIPRGAAYDMSSLPADKEWILFVGDHPSPKASYQISGNGFVLAFTRDSTSIDVDFRKFNWPGIVSRTRGLSGAESWGTWSASGIISLEFHRPLPLKFRVDLVAFAFGPNVGKAFEVSVDDSVAQLTLSHAPEQRTFDFDNPKNSNVLSIRVPSPVSPKELGLSADDRRLGIGLVQMTITPLP